MLNKVIIRNSFVAFVLIVFFSTAQAAEVHTGIELGSSTTSSVNFKDNQAIIGSMRLFGALALDNTLSIEAAYTIMGDFHHKTGIGPLPYEISVDSYEVVAIGKFKVIDSMSVLVLVGPYNWTDEHYIDNELVQTYTDTDVTYGIGMESLISNNWSLGFKIQRYQRDDGELDLYTLRCSYFFK